MHNECIPIPNEEKWLEIAEGYQQRAQFPNCIGAIDGKHIRVIKPHGSGSHYFNYKHFFSVVLLAVVDSNYCFTFIDVGSFGKDSDPTIFKNSTLYKKLQNDSLNIPKPNLIRGIQIPMPYAFVGDEAFGLSTNMLRPYAGKCLPINKRIFNYRLSRARRYVECAFGILSNKWRIFHRAIDVDIELAIDIVKCCCVLHNFVRARDGYEFEDSLMVTGELIKETDHCHSPNIAQVEAKKLVNSMKETAANEQKSTRNNISENLEDVSIPFGDGSFKSVPSIFSRLYTVHCHKNESVLPLIYVLMADRTKDTYTEVLNQLLKCKSDLDPKSIQIDFEQAFISAFIDIFSNAKINGCFFHFRQCVWRKIQSLELQKVYSENSKFALQVKQLCALAFIPVHDVLYTFKELIKSEYYIENEPLFQPILNYFKDTWIGRPVWRKRSPIFSFNI
ncbi:hypothetical protein QTP88_016668 [Uroleucon formosanum]